MKKVSVMVFQNFHSIYEKIFNFLRFFKINVVNENRVF